MNKSTLISEINTNIQKGRGLLVNFLLTSGLFLKAEGENLLLCDLGYIPDVADKDAFIWADKLYDQLNTGKVLDDIVKLLVFNDSSTNMVLLQVLYSDIDEKIGQFSIVQLEHDSIISKPFDRADDADNCLDLFRRTGMKEALGWDYEILVRFDGKYIVHAWDWSHDDDSTFKTIVEAYEYFLEKTVMEKAFCQNE